MTKKIEDCLSKGKYYLVPCIPIPDRFTVGYLAFEKGWLPVFQTPHIDIETAFAPEDRDRLKPLEVAAHYHIDIRFIKSDLPIGTSIGISAQIAAQIMDLDDWDEISIEWKRKKCYRAAVDDFENSIVPGIYESNVIAQELKLTDIKVCPHQKTCLKGVPKVGNAVVCPAHGLKWDVLSGDLIPRTKRIFTAYGIAMTKEYLEILEFLDINYATLLAENNIKYEVWTKLLVAYVTYYDRSTFEADRSKYL